MLPSQDLSVIQGPTERKRRTDSHKLSSVPYLCSVEYTPIKYIDKCNLTMSNNNKHIETYVCLGEVGHTFKPGRQISMSSGPAWAT